MVTDLAMTQLAIGADPFPNDPTQWVDADGDGYGDNVEGNNPDLFPRDITQWFDSDGDGFGDNQNGVNPDAFPDDSTQWIDADGDGLGDNINGTNPDPSQMTSITMATLTAKIHFLKLPAQETKITTGSLMIMTLFQIISENFRTMMVTVMVT